MAAIRHKEMTSADDIRETPRALFDQLDERFRFTLDAAATPENALVSRFYTEHGFYDQVGCDTEWSVIPSISGLTGPWGGERVFCNPPFSTIDEWVCKAWGSNAELVCMICPVTRTGRAWWHELVEPYRDGRCKTATGGLHLTTEFLPGRVQYTVNGGQPIRDKKTGKKTGCMFDSMLLIWQR
jgi:hypothetical protein